jgi:hypothetical protein
MQAQVTILPIICRAHFDGADFLPALLEVSPVHSGRGKLVIKWR